MIPSLMFKSDRGGIEIKNTLQTTKELYPFKSDRGGIEISESELIKVVTGEGSNQTVAGLKSLIDLQPHKDAVFKSDRGGIEI